MADLSESFEANMLQNLKRQALEGTDDEDENGDKKQQSRGKNLQRHLYGNDCLTDSSDDTSYGTMKGPVCNFVPLANLSYKKMFDTLYYVYLSLITALFVQLFLKTEHKWNYRRRGKQLEVCSAYMYLC